MQSISRFGGFVLLAVACLTIMVGCVIVPGLDAIAQALGVPTLAGWLVTVPSLGVVLCGPLAARLLGRIGLRNGLRLGLFGYGALGFGGAFLHGAWALLLDRLLLGGATALVMAAGTGLLSSFYHGPQRLVMIARQGMAIELGGVVFLFVGGLLAGLGWRYPFALYLFAWLLWALLEIGVPAQPRQVGSDEPGEPRLPPRQWLVYLSAGLSMVVFFAAVISLPRHLAGLGLDAARIGYFLAYVSLVAVFAAALMPRAARRFGEVGTLVRAFAFYTSGHLLFALGHGLATDLLGGLALGIGFGLSVPLVNHMTVDMSPEAVRGQRLAYLSMAIFLGQFLSSLLELLPGGAAMVFWGAAGLALLTALGLPALQRRCMVALAAEI
ncbi:MAG: hypothetical protein GAK43_02381 [Stenotrophomonas maltophilia]|nr:MAG: hypothetical protein GAK43_02381 [Stenotrophomonas maltophilia]